MERFCFITERFGAYRACVSPVRARKSREKKKPAKTKLHFQRTSVHVFLRLFHCIYIAMKNPKRAMHDKHIST